MKAKLKSIGIILLLITFSSLFFSIININKSTITEKEYLLYYTLSQFILTLILVIIYYKDLKRDLLNYNHHIFFTSIKYWIIGLIIMVTSNYFITYILNLSLAGNEQAVRSYIDISPLLMVINTCIFAPLTEELTFRKSIKDAINNKWIYILTSGLLFGLIHIVAYISKPIHLVYLIPYGALGIIFAYTYHKTQNIYSTITMHAIHNTVAIIIYLLGVTI